MFIAPHLTKSQGLIMSPWTITRQEYPGYRRSSKEKSFQFMGYNLIPLSGCVRDQVMFSAQECWGMLTSLAGGLFMSFLHSREKVYCPLCCYSLCETQVSVQVTSDRDPAWPPSASLHWHWEPHLGARFRPWAWHGLSSIMRSHECQWHEGWG